TATLKVITRDVIRGGLQRTCIESACDAVRAVSPAVDQRLQMHAGHGAVFFHTGFVFHQHRMAAAVAVENLFPRQADLYWAIEKERSFGDDDFVIKGIALSTESTAIRRRDDPNMRRWHLQHFRESAVQVVRSLRTRPNRKLAVWILDGDRRVL